MSDIAVVYLVWQGLGPEALRRFIASYQRFDAGVPHRLVLVFKEFPEGAPREAYLDMIAGMAHERLEMPGTVLDIPAYFRIAAQRAERYLCFLNSQAEILSPQWLALLYAHVCDPAIGVAGATGSWESHLTDAIHEIQFQARKLGVPCTDDVLRQSIPAAYFNFQAFPNPHVRTNGFMIERSRFLSLPFVPANDKLQCYLFESGKLGMTMHLQRQGLRTVIVGRDGKSHDPARWPDSRLFRSGHQENLLIADAHTHAYEGADFNEQARLRLNAWGRP